MPKVRAREKLDSLSIVNTSNIKSLVLLAYDDPELAEKVENSFMLNSMEKPKR
jgi:hypothetical protein